MVFKKLIWSTNAEITLDETLGYYTAKNKIHAKNMYNEIREYTLKLLQFPNLGKPVEETLFRQLIIDKYSVYYTILDQQILVVLFWDNRRSPKLLEHELLRIK
jgi:plasmid stabilization system protein ParE